MVDQCSWNFSFLCLVLVFSFSREFERGGGYAVVILIWGFSILTLFSVGGVIRYEGGRIWGFCILSLFV